MLLSILSFAFAVVVTGIYGFSAVLAARYSFKVWTNTTICVGLATAAELLTDGLNALLAHAHANSYCPWLMVSPYNVTLVGHLTDVFGSYPQTAVEWTLCGLATAICAFWCWFMAQPVLFILSLFLLIYSGITTFFFVNTSITISQRAYGATSQEAPFW